MFQVTQDLFVGRFAARERLAALRSLGITDIVNVSDSPSLLTVNDGPFRGVSWFHIEDRILIPTADAIVALDAIHSALSADGGRVFVHCMAGWNRSPTILWLYLIACGMDQNLAAKAISGKAPDAVPGHSLLIDERLIKSVVAHGHHHYAPHPRASSIELPIDKCQSNN